MKTIQSVGNPAVHTMFGKLVVPPYPASRDGGHSWCPLSHSQLIFAFLSWSHVSSGCRHRSCHCTQTMPRSSIMSLSEAKNSATSESQHAWVRALAHTTVFTAIKCG